MNNILKTITITSFLFAAGCASDPATVAGPTSPDQSAPHVGLVVSFRAKAGKEGDVAGFLKNALALAEAEPATLSWYAVKIGDDQFGVFDSFVDESGREAHLKGKIAAALFANQKELVEGDIDVRKVDIGAAKIEKGQASVGLFISLAPQPGKAQALADFLDGGEALVEKEPGTPAWYTFNSGATFGIFDVFPNDDARQAHLHGALAAALTAKAPDLLSDGPKILDVEVLAAKTP